MRKNALTLKINKKAFVLYLLYFVIMIGAFVLPPSMEIFLTVFCVFAMAFMAVSAYMQRDGDFLADMLAFPVLVTATQNLYLGLAVRFLSTLELQVLLSVNILLIIGIVICYLIFRKKIESRNGFCLLILAVLFLHTIMLYGAFPSGLTALISNFRNLSACILIYWVSVTFGERLNSDRFFAIINGIAVFVILFGLIEAAVGNELWKSLNIKELWVLKGIGTNTWGIPRNWYSSEKIAGQQLRRMVSSFADPVNLGTYLFASFMAAWYSKKRILQFFLIICCVLTVSKGALLGFLIFAIVYAWYKDKKKILSAVVLLAVFAAGGLFMSYSKSSSTGSVFLHIKGFLSSLEVLFKQPFGYGVGRVGVLSSLFSTDFYVTPVTETGIGMIIAQLGIIGLLSYTVFFGKLFMVPQKWKSRNKMGYVTEQGGYKQDKKFLRGGGYFLEKKIIFYTLLISFAANATFNEVALSPNSCALYFLILGIVTAQMHMGE